MSYFDEVKNNWGRQRWGKFTASCIYRLMGSAKSFDTYVDEVACEAYTEYEENQFDGTWEMRQGRIKEPIAFKFHENLLKIHLPADRFIKIEYFGDGNPNFKEYNEHAGASADCVVFKDVNVAYFGGEYKCPKRDTHFDRIRSMKEWTDLKERHPDYYWQCQFNMMCWNVDMWHWCSFNELFPLKDRLLIIEVPANKADQQKLKIKLSDAIIKKKEILSSLTL